MFYQIILKKKKKKVVVLFNDLFNDFRISGGSLKSLTFSFMKFKVIQSLHKATI